ncbi:MAG: phosphoribosylglycinamide formyltransferase [Bacteroidetes bacterium]|nr:phosphoribosylglycinamide formyltransferase [Bacteroidota bacterium]
MTASSDNRPVRLGILGSTKGTDMQALIDAVAAKSLPAEIAVVLSDRPCAFILERAAQHGIASSFIPVYTGPKGMREKKERTSYDNEISSILKKSGVDLVLLIGYMRILSVNFCESWKNRVINVHPSLLPDFSGGMDTDVHTAVLNAKKKETGCTVHLVTPELDAGPIILQKRCPVYEDDTPETLKKRVQELEGTALIDVVRDFQQNGYFTTIE